MFATICLLRNTILIKNDVLWIFYRGVAIGLETFYENSNYKSGWKPLVKESSLNAVSSVVTEQQGAPEKTAGTVKKQAAPVETELHAATGTEKAESVSCACAVGTRTNTEGIGRTVSAEAGSPSGIKTEKKEPVPCSCAAEARTKTEAGGQAASAAETETPEPSEILEKLSRLGAEIDALNHRILRQGEKIDSMLQLMEKMSEKRSIFRAEKK